MSKKNKSNLGRSLIKDRFGNSNTRRKVNNDSMLHTTEVQDGYDWGRLNLQSVTEESSFQEFLRTAELAGTEFQAEKLNIAFVNPKSNVGLLSKTEEKLLEKKHFDKKDLLKIPRRPKWNQSTTAEDLQRAEGEAFLEWRRNIALLQEDDQILLTPYEKNLEFWRQLWRVVEKSDVVVQIVDARNPLLFRSKDLENYVKEVDQNKMNMILINKSDLLTPEQRVIWAEYFDRENIKVAFFSAVLAEEEAKAEKLKEKQNEASSEDDNDDEDKIKSASSASDEADESENDDPKTIVVEELKKATEAIIKSLNKTEEQLKVIENKIGISEKQSKNKLNSPQLLNRAELTELFRNVYKRKTFMENNVTIGLVGYPNVGKSSTINALMAEKKVSVSATPGKTKHFQTLFLEKDILLCDCPGLVMPSFVLTKADMILNGILPIDQMRDHVPPVNLLCNRIPRHILEDKYGILIAKPIEGEDPNRPPHAEELLLAYGYNRGFMTANGQPDQSRSARYLLKDYVNGKLLFCHAPTGVEQETFHTFPSRTKKTVEEESLPKQQQRAMRINKNTTASEINDQFFKSNNGLPHAKGRASFPYIGNSSQGGADGVANPNKPWRRPKKEKREKLRKKFSHLDQH